MKLKHFFLSSFIFINFYLKAQTTIQTTNDRGQPIVGALLYNQDKTISYLSNTNGKVPKANFQKGDTIYIQHTAYTLKKIPFQSQKYLNIQLKAKPFLLHEITVYSANRLPEKRENIPQQITMLTAEDIAERNVQTSADLLFSTGKVFVQKSQMGGGSPVLRGLEANRVLIVVDGVRMNNAIYRGGHLQNVITLDANIQDRVEVLFGPNSVMYGSDALGGVMHFYSKKPEFNQQPEGNILSRVASANQEWTNHLDLSWGSDKAALLTSFTFARYGDLRAGRNTNPFFDFKWNRNFYVERQDNEDRVSPNQSPELQKFSGYQQWDFTQKISLKQNQFTSYHFNFQLSNSSDVPRFDRLTDLDSEGKPRNAEWYYGPQKRIFGLLHIENTQKSWLYDQVNLRLSYQNIEESRITRRFQNENRRHRIESLDIFGLNADFQKTIQTKFDLKYGVEAYLNQVASSAFSENILTNERSPTTTRYPEGGNTLNLFGVYASNKWTIDERLIFSQGLRLSYTSLRSNFGSNILNFPFQKVEQDNLALTGNLGLVAKFNRNWRLATSLATGFRSPNIDDVGKVFDSGDGVLIIPNDKLKPEQTLNLEASLTKVFGESLEIEATVYHIWLRNMLRIQNTQLAGQSIVDFEGVQSQVQHNANIGLGHIWGFTLDLEVEVTSNLLLLSSLTYTKGRDTSADVPLGHIPPLFGQTSLVWTWKKMRHEFFSNYQGWKRIEDYSPSGEDNQRYAVPNEGMPAWFTLNYRFGYDWRKFTFQLSIENILDTHYRIFASGISAAGRNVALGLRVKI